MRKIWIEETGSTNSWVKERLEDLEAPVMAIARCQTAGRGQRGNSWESEPGKNLTFSLLVKPSGLKAVRQFALSEAAALAMADALAAYGIEAAVKWPNDIYVGSRKIAGILIENSIMGDQLTTSIIGIGLNVNQTLFLSDAPNPVSMAQISRRKFHLGEVANTVGGELEKRLGSLAAGESMHDEYKSRLWRSDGRHYPFKETAGGEEFTARIADVGESGHLILELSDGCRRKYAFKEVAYLGIF